MKKNERNKVSVEIFGQKYTLTGEGSAEYIAEVAGMVDERMKDLADKNPTLDTTKTAVLTAVNLAEDFVTLQKDYEDLLNLIEEQTKSGK